MNKLNQRFKIAQELLDIAEFQFIRRLKSKRPKITATEIQSEVRDWYKKQTGSFGTEISIKEFLNE